MQYRSLGKLIEILALLLIQHAVHAEKGPSKGTLSFRVVDVSTGGVFLATLKEESGRIRRAQVAAKTPQVDILFGSVPLGTHRIEIHHDLDNDAQKDQGEWTLAGEGQSWTLRGPHRRVYLSEKRSEPWTGKIDVELSGFRNDRGVARVALFNAKKGFPNDASTAVDSASVSIEANKAQATFHLLPPGLYALGALHDENENGRMDTRLLGIPLEGHGASNNAQGSMGPPPYKAAQFQLSPPGAKIRIQLDY